MSNIKVDDEYESTNAMQRPQDIFNLIIMLNVIS